MQRSGFLPGHVDQLIIYLKKKTQALAKVFTVTCIYRTIRAAGLLNVENINVVYLYIFMYHEKENVEYCSDIWGTLSKEFVYIDVLMHEKNQIVQILT